MRLSATTIPLVTYVVGFQTLVYLLVPLRFRPTWAPLVTSSVGAIVVVAAALWFGGGVIGLAGPDGGLLAAWGSATMVAMTSVGMVMMSRPQLRGHLADPRMGAMSTRGAAAHILLRIPLITVVIEEAMFRGVLHAALVTLYAEPIAIWGGAVLFGLWHIGPGLDQADAVDRRKTARFVHVLITVMATTAAGAFLVWLRIETGSIWVPVAVHAGVNMTLATFARLATALPRPIPRLATDEF
ncbi:MAG TPA: type II CAAX endopeptidase family protein [Acidimicrobiia bacterium]|nr:type II CAAX endopeptidase family protein [Acidimicrobiia bacterium]